MQQESAESKDNGGIRNMNIGICEAGAWVDWGGSGQWNWGRHGLEKMDMFTV